MRRGESPDNFMSTKAYENNFYYCGMFSLYNLRAVWPNGKNTIIEPRLSLYQILASFPRWKTAAPKLSIKLAITKIRDDRANLIGEIELVRT